MKRLFYFLLTILASGALASQALGQMTVTPSSVTYHRFLVADVGLTSEGGKANDIFRVQFASGPIGNHYVAIDVKDGSGASILTGQTNAKDYATSFENKTFTNYNIADASNLGGSFTIKSGGAAITDKILATGALPEGDFTITLRLMTGATTVDTDIVNVRITAPYLQPIYPVDISTTRSAMNFRWRSNIDNMEFHLYSDPRGNSELISGSRLPQSLGPAVSMDGSVVAPFLSGGAHYFWQIWGTINTSHGPERAKGPFSEFLYFEEAADVVYLGLSDTDKDLIKDELLEILTELVNRRVARSLQDYELDRIVFDNGVLTRDEVFSILELIKNKEVTVNSINFR